MHDYSITFACYNSIEYTKKFVSSLVESNTPLDRIVAVDNGSSDGTLEFLRTSKFGAVIANKTNLGCGVAWNQGALEHQAEWTIVMNNDVLVSRDWADRLITMAEDLDVSAISPAMIEGALDYDFRSFCETNQGRMHGVSRIGAKHAVCLAVKNSVWQDLGYFVAKPSLLGYEDTIFFNELERGGYRTAGTGAVWVHHFGSVTQDQLKKERGLASTDALGPRNNYKNLGLNWLERKLRRYSLSKMASSWRKAELDEFGMTLHGLRQNNEFIWK